MKNKKTLIIFEGVDRVGKNSAINYLSLYNNIFAYNKKVSPPHYREDPVAFEKWLVDYLKLEAYSLASIDTPIILIDRLFTSDYVYSNIFHRSSYINNIYNYLYSRDFNFLQIIMLYKDFSVYKNRCKKVNNELEYTEEEFLFLQLLYKTSIFNLAIPTYFITVDDLTTKEEVYLKCNDWLKKHV